MLCQAGVSQVLNLLAPKDFPSNAERVRYRKAWLSRGIEALELPIRNGGVPTGASARPALFRLVDHVKERRPGVFYIHCLGGCGRTGTLAAALLLALGEASLEDVWEKLDELRGDLGGPCPETAVQRKAAVKICTEMEG